MSSDKRKIDFRYSFSTFETHSQFWRNSNDFRLNVQCISFSNGICQQSSTRCAFMSNLIGSSNVIRPLSPIHCTMYWCCCCHRRKIVFRFLSNLKAWSRMRSRVTKSVLGPLFRVAYKKNGSSCDLQWMSVLLFSVVDIEDKHLQVQSYRLSVRNRCEFSRM